MSFKDFFLDLYRFIFSRKDLYNLNLHLYKLTLRGLGILNSGGGKITGEDSILDFLSKNFKINVVFDIGANDGGYSKTLRYFFKKSTIYAFEPHPESFERLKKSVTGNKTKIYRLGLGSKAKMGKIWDFSNDAQLKHTQPTSTLASTHKEVIENYHGQKSHYFDIRIITLDSFIQENKIKKIDFLKIDTEGSEFDILLGAKKSLESGKISFIQFEFNEMNAYSKVHFKNFVDLLPNFEFFRLLPNSFVK